MRVFDRIFAKVLVREVLTSTSWSACASERRRVFPSSLETTRMVGDIDRLLHTLFIEKYVGTMLVLNIYVIW